MVTATELVDAVARRHGLPSAPVDAPSWPGMVNDVVVVGDADSRYVLRTPLDPREGNVYDVEAWCSAVARAAGIPTPQVSAVGEIDQIPYSVQAFAGEVTAESDRDDRWWMLLGDYARRIGALPLNDAPDSLFSRFGRDPAAAWAAHVDYNLDQLSDSDPLLELGVYGRDGQERVRRVIRSLGDAPLRFGLSHGDLALRNLLIGDDGEPALIDWGSAAVGPIPHTDLLNLLRNHRTLDNPRRGELDAFARGYRVDLAALGPELQAMRMLAAIDLVRWAQEVRPDRLAEAVLSARALLAE